MNAVKLDKSMSEKPEILFVGSIAWPQRLFTTTFVADLMPSLEELGTQILLSISKATLPYWFTHTPTHQHVIISFHQPQAKAATRSFNSQGSLAVTILQFFKIQYSNIRCPPPSLKNLTFTFCDGLFKKYVHQGVSQRTLCKKKNVHPTT